MRDSGNNYLPLERLFGTLTQGMAFGEISLLNPYKLEQKFYNAVALTECYLL
jgi:hypothetical protein